MATINVALIGQGFMGRTHSNAWGQVAKFFKPPLVARDAHGLWAAGGESPRCLPTIGAGKTPRPIGSSWSARRRSGWSTWSRRTTCTPRWPGRPSPPASRWPARSRSPARWPTPARWSTPPRRPRSRRSSGSTTGVAPPWHLPINWSRRASSARSYHVRATYLQDWAGESVPLLWRFDKKLAGSGAHGDLNAHIIDMTRFVTGQEITEVAGAIAETFIKERTPDHRAWPPAASPPAVKARAGKGKVTVDDTVLFLARFSGGAVASFEAARQATGNQNRNGFEINGSKGSIKFNFERMNELQYYDATLPRAVQGWTHDHVYPRRRPSVCGQLVARRPPHRLRTRLYQPGIRHPQGVGGRGADGADPRFRGRLSDAAGAGSGHDFGRPAAAGKAGGSEVAEFSRHASAQAASRRGRRG